MGQQAEAAIMVYLKEMGYDMILASHKYYINVVFSNASRILVSI